MNFFIDIHYKTIYRPFRSECFSCSMLHKTRYTANKYAALFQIPSIETISNCKSHSIINYNIAMGTCHINLYYNKSNLLCVNVDVIVSDFWV